jgi:hypothetical protein
MSPNEEESEYGVPDEAVLDDRKPDISLLDLPHPTLA